MSEQTGFKIPWHRSLVIRSVLCILAMITTIIGVAGWSSIISLREEKISQLDQQARYISRITTQALSLPMWNIDKAQVLQQLQALGGSEIFCGARVLDSDKSLFVDSNFPSNLREDQYIHTENINIDPKNGARDSETVGSFELCVSKTILEQQIQKAIESQIWLFAIICLSVLGAYYVSLLIITKPLLSIQTAMEQLVTTMKPIRDPKLISHNEIGAMSHSFNKMVIGLSKTYNALKIAKENAVKAGQAKTEFLANMSHELRTPLNIIIGMTQIIQQQGMNQEQKDSFALIKRSSQTLLDIVNDILDLTKIEAGEMQLESIAFNVREKINNTIQSMNTLASQKGLTLSGDIEDQDYVVVGDPLRFERIIINLVSNAIRYTDKGGITIKVRFEENPYNQVRLQCDIIDTGIGIPENKTEKIFEKFTQADTSTTRRYGGTGLGLTITKQLVEMMDGKIGVTSEVGKGSNFWFNIPFVRSNEQHAKRSEKTIHKSWEKHIATTIPAREAKILMAEDNEVNRVFMGKLLESQGLMNYTCVENGLDAIEAVKNEKYDLILMDCNMPELSGYDATIAIRALNDETARNVPIIALTANAMPEDKARCLEIGMNGYVSKPFKIHELLSEISTWIELAPKESLSA